MNPRLADALLLAALLALAVWVALSGQGLPDRVATGFSLQGAAQDWMSRAEYLVVALGLQLLLPIGLLALPWFIARAPDRQISLPHRDHWLAPERRQATLRWIGSHLRWFTLLVALWLAGLHALGRGAQALNPPVLHPGLAMALLGSFLVGTAAWLLALWWHFHQRA